MEGTIRHANPSDLDGIAAFAADAQQDPRRHIVYLGMDAGSIAADIVGLDAWTMRSVVAERRGAIVGALVPDIDEAMGRVWWWGPFAETDDWDPIADALYTTARPLLPSTDIGAEPFEEEVAGDQRNDNLAAWAERHDFIPNHGSALLRLEKESYNPSPQPPAGPILRPAVAADVSTIAQLHDAAFPGTHTTADALLRSEHPRLVAERHGVVVGYIAYETQSDGSGYIDYLAVEPSARRSGVGDRLVRRACDDLFFRDVTHIHLGVWESNVAARRMYRRIGFEDERVAVPYRRGFDLDDPPTETDAS